MHNQQVLEYGLVWIGAAGRHADRSAAMTLTKSESDANSDWKISPQSPTEQSGWIMRLLDASNRSGKFATRTVKAECVMTTLPGPSNQSEINLNA